MGGNHQNMTEKIVQRFAVGLDNEQTVHSGDYVSIAPAHVMSHDNTGAIIKKFRTIGASKMANPRQPVFALDHNIQDKSEENLAKYANIEAFAREMGVDFYPAGRGISHQVMCEEGYVLPGTMVVASDSHSNMYGGLGCLGTPIVRTDAAAIWATGRTWWQVPNVARLTLTGELRKGVTAKDIIVTLCGHFNNDEVLNHVVEVVGDGVQTLGIDQRLTISNMSTEWGALGLIFPADDTAYNWLSSRADQIEDAKKNQVTADPDARYSKDLTLDLSTVSPFISGPNHVKAMTPAEEMGHIKIQKAYLLSCVNSRVEDLAAAAKVVRGNKVASGVEFYVAAASSEVQEESERRGDFQSLVEAGAIPLPPGCGPCIGLGVGLLQDGEVGISATNRNFKGRMGSRNAEAYLGSPEVVAASALAGVITAPFDVEVVGIKGEVSSIETIANASSSVEILKGFPTQEEGKVLFCHEDNLNTDGIFPGKYTYIDDFTDDQQASVVMENYDPEFKSLAQKGDILIGGFNFGTGSSREQAATALKHKGITLLIAGSFSTTYKRNAINNGFIVLECPELVRDLNEQFKRTNPTVVTNKKAKISFETSTLEFDGKAYGFSPLGTAVQELILAGGLESWVKQKLD